jgi:hypothetical protein
VLLVSYIINLPSFFVFYVRSDQEFENEATLNLSGFVYCGPTALSLSRTGILIVILVFLIRDVLTLLIEIIFSGILINYFKKYAQNHQNQFPITIIDSANPHTNPNGRSRRPGDDQKLLQMTICINISSIFSHLVVVSVYLFYLNPSLIFSIPYFSLVYVSYISIGIKHSTNFFVYYFFNNHFKNALFAKLN